jgi:hypothetical protein
MRFPLPRLSTLVLLVSLSLPSSAAAAAVTTRTDFSNYLAFGDGCTREPGTLTGTLHNTFLFDTDAHGNLHIVSRSHYSNTTFTTDSGSVYRLANSSGSTQQIINHAGGFPVTLASSFAFNLVGPDGQFHGTGTFIFVINGVGDVTVSFERSDADCFP